MKSLRVVFFGNHTVGVAALEVLHRQFNLVGVVAHPFDVEDGVAYQSVFQWATENAIMVVRGKGRDTHVFDFVSQLSPQLIWVTDYRYLLPVKIINAAPYGAVNLHPSLLPAYRGRAPINWAILNGEDTLGITAHVIDDGIDSGPIIEQISYSLNKLEDVSDALKKLLPLYRRITLSAIEKITNPDFKPKQQLVGATRIFKARNAADGEINWLLTATEIVNLIRAVAFPYPGAFTHLGFKKIVIWKASVVKTSHTHPSGTIVSGTDKEFVVVCGVGSLKVSCWTLDGVDEFPKSCVLQKLESPALSRDGTVAHYESLLDLHGDSFKTLDWGSQAGQNKRFQVLACIAPLSGCRLLDVGCGLGHLANWLKDHAADYYSYTGIDIVPGLLAMAKKRHPSKCFILADISDESVLIDEKFDYVFASGIFYTYSSAAEGFLKRCVESMWKRATKGVAFNALSSKTVDKVNEEYYADVDSVLEFCKSLSPNVELIEGYHPRDFTIYMKRSAS